MTTQLSAMKQALEALEMQLHGAGSIINSKMAWDALNTAIQEAEQQEPVAWMCPDDPERETAFNWYAGKCDQKGCNAQRIPLYTQPPAAKEWQWLTDGEVQLFIEARWSNGVNFTHFIRAIEAKLKEKNT